MVHHFFSFSSFCRFYIFFTAVWFCGSFHTFHRPRFHREPSTSTLEAVNHDNKYDGDYTAVMIVPTGIGASIGGYAGDALPAARLLSCVVDRLITHPNVLNGAMMYWPMSNVLYVEGYALDEFAAGRMALQPLSHGGQRIGLLLDKGMEEELVQRHLQVADAARATLGLDVAACVITSRPVGVTVAVSQASGASWGSIEDSETLVEGARALVDNHGCTAIAVVVRFPEDDDMDKSGTGTSPSPDADLGSSPSPGASAASLFAAYREGSGVDFIAGAEALISHVITQRVGVPCAHAPAFATEEGGPSPYVSPKAAAEELGYTFLPCVLAYLHRAPSLVPIALGLVPGQEPVPGQGLVPRGSGLSGSALSGLVMADDVDAVVVPYSALGGPAVLSLMSRGQRHRDRDTRKVGSRLRPLLVVAVGDNDTTMRVTAKDLIGQEEGENNDNSNSDNNNTGFDVKSGSGSSSIISSSSSGSSRSSSSVRRGVVEIVHVRSYAECAGILAAHRGGIRLNSLTSNVPPISVTRL